jgi:hypothetical protein
VKQPERGSVRERAEAAVGIAGGDLWFVDSLLEEAVTSEPVSV